MKPRRFLPLGSFSTWMMILGTSYTLINSSPSVAEDKTWANIQREFEVTVTVLSAARTISKNCKINSDALADSFISTFADLAQIDRSKIEPFVAFGYKIAQELHSPDCKVADLQVYLKLFDQHAADLFRDVLKYTSKK